MVRAPGDIVGKQREVVKTTAHHMIDRCGDVQTGFTGHELNSYLATVPYFAVGDTRGTQIYEVSQVTRLPEQGGELLKPTGYPSLYSAVL